jgi:hypothetical protein
MTCKRAYYFLAVTLTAFSLCVEAAEEPAVDAENSTMTNAENPEELVLNPADGNRESDAELEQAEGDDDFVPSTQISEDLSVSFPVDI